MSDFLTFLYVHYIKPYLDAQPRDDGDTFRASLCENSQTAESQKDVDAVVETMRGHHLGRVILQGAAIPNTGVPGVIAGYAAERVIHAPASGEMVFVQDENGKTVDIGALVHKEQEIARVGGVPVLATIDGVLRGLIRAGYPVTEGLKIADIDPRPEQVAYCDTVSDKARAIGGGVVEALLRLAREKNIRLL